MSLMNMKLGSRARTWPRIRVGLADFPNRDALILDRYLHPSDPSLRDYSDTMIFSDSDKMEGYTRLSSTTSFARCPEFEK
jgi:hypothetical protein